MILVTGKKIETLMVNRAAFSLFELLIVLALLALLASVALPALQSWQSRIEVDRASGALIELIGEAKRRAVHEGHTWVVHSLKTPAALKLETQKDATVRLPMLKTVVGDMRTLPKSVQIDFFRSGTDRQLQSLTISSQGNITPAVIWLSQNGQRVQAYEVDRLTSRLRRFK